MSTLMQPRKGRLASVPTAHFRWSGKR